MPREARQLLANAVPYAFAVLAGFNLAIIVILNLHIVVGLEEGYGSSPAQVLDFSILLVVVDCLLLLGGPALGILAVWKFRHREGGRFIRKD